ncbi:hypothetical protein [Rhizorhapis sp.]|uniref:hypothetical protein n=1 Tax=Rhizorhapis sp. TaxID=1968842 RepID=UPI002B49A23A|nr:hypothetical protein [Rhizorhapis sp.]HKR17657.1 hypothetical protein [Rhizorhapis sp.]
MLATVPFPAWTPDVPLTTGDFSNVTAIANGYGPVKAFSAVTTALSGILGGASFIGADGTSRMLGGTATNLYHYVGGTWASVLGALSATIWRFDQFGDNVIAVNGAAPVSYAIAAGTAAALGGSPPASDLVATVRQQAFLAGNPSARNTLSISGYNNSAQWTAGTNQSLSVPFPSGGDIMGLCGGETGVILQQRSVKRATYTGDVTVWQFDEISKDIGCMAKGSVAQAGLLVFFLSDQGFKVCDRNQVLPIGVDEIDEFFFKSYSRADIVSSIRAAVDPRSTTVTWSMPGDPGRLWSYNWTRKKWSVAETGVKMVFQGFTLNTSLEGIDALYPGGIDTVPYSLDASIFAGGQPLFLIVNYSDTVGTLTGDNLAMSIALPPMEIEQGKSVRITGAWLISDATTGTVTIDARKRAGDSPNLKVSGSMRGSGRLPLRSNGQWNGIRVQIPASATWTYCNGVRLEYTIEGAK